MLGIVGAKAQPVGGSVVAGQAQITTAGGTTLINQSSAKAIINWQDFSVAKGAAVQFNQPNSSSLTLNRVTGTGISAINGSLTANGQVWLLNPNGLLIGNGAQINVGGLLATTSDLANQDFLAGRYNFSGGGSGAIVNNGAIKAAPGGAVVLSAPRVVNNGIIAARAGHVVLAGTDTFTVDFDGDHLISYAVGDTKKSGTVVNTGAIKAGNVLLTAKAAQGVQDAVVNNTGMVEARSARVENGEIVLEADGGAATDSGTLDATGRKDGETGGTVKVLGTQVAIADGAKIDVSGNAGGGTALIGGNFHGAGPEQNAQSTTVGDARIKVDAIKSGNGGKVAVWSNGTTQFAGHISARGGSAGGNGGQVETSGHYLGVADSATVTAAAGKGEAGTWLLDPTNITIATTGANDTNTNIAFGDTPANAIIAPSTIVSALTTGNTDVLLQAVQDITVTDAVETTTNHKLELDAGHSIILNNDINLNVDGTSTGSTLVLSANDPGSTAGNASTASITGTGFIAANNITLQLAGASAGIGTSSTVPLALDYFGSTPMVLTVTSGSSVFLTSAADTTQISAPGVNVGTNTFSLVETTGPISQAAGGSITAGAINLQTAGSAIGSGTPVNVAALSGALALTVATNGASASISSTSAVALGAVNLSNGSPTNAIIGDFTLASSGDITQTGGIIAQDLSVSTTGTGHGITLSGNTIGGTVRFNTDAGSDVSYTSSSDVILGNSLVGGALDIEAIGNDQAISLSDAAGAVSAGGLLTLHASGNISQTIPLTAGSLTAISDMRQVDLSYDRLPDPDNGVPGVGNSVLGTVSTDGSDTVGGVVTLSGVGVVSFTNHAANTVLGDISLGPDGEHYASLDIEVRDPYGSSGPHANLYLNGNITAPLHDDVNFPGVTNDQLLHASGDIVNLMARSTIAGDALILNSDFGNIGGEEPNGSGANFISSNVTSLSLFLGPDVGGGTSAQYAQISNSGSYAIGTDMGGINAGAGSVTLGAGAGGIVTQHGGPSDQSGMDGSIAAGSLSMVPNGGYTLDNQLNSVGTLASHTTGAGVFVNSGSLVLDQVDGNLFDNGNGMTPAGDFSVNVLGGDLSQTGAEMTIGGTALFAAHFGTITLDGTANRISGQVTLEGGQSGNTPFDITFLNNGDTSLGYVGGKNSDNNPIEAGNISVVVSGGDLTLNDNVLAQTSVRLQASGNILQNTGMVTADGAGGGVTLTSTGDAATGGIGNTDSLVNVNTSNLSVTTGGGDANIYATVPGVGNGNLGLQVNMGTTGMLVLTAADANVNASNSPVIAGGLTVTALDTSFNPSCGTECTTQHSLSFSASGNVIMGTISLFADGYVDLTNTVDTHLGQIGSPYASQLPQGNVDGPASLGVAVDGSLHFGGTVQVLGDLSLSAGTGITQDATAAIIQQALNGEVSFSAVTPAGGISLTSPANSIAGESFLQAPGDIALANTVNFYISAINGGSISGLGEGVHSAANSVTLVAHDPNPDASFQPGILQDPEGAGITAHSISLTTTGADMGQLPCSDCQLESLILSGGPVLNSDQSAIISSDGANFSLALSTGGGTAYLNSLSPVTIAAIGANNGINLGSGSLYLNAGGDIQVNAPIASLNGTIALDTAGSIAVNADITADAIGSSGAGTIILTANDACAVDDCGAMNSDTAGITANGTATLTAGSIILDVEQGPDRTGGGIGAAGTPLKLSTTNNYDPDSGLPVVSLSVGTYGGDVYLAAATGVNFSQIESCCSIDLTVPDATDDNDNPLPHLPAGNFTLTAAGPITESYGIFVRDLNLATTVSGASITLGIAGTGPSCSDCDDGVAGNTVTGIARFNTVGGDVRFASAAALQLGASGVNGNLTVTALNTPNNGAQILIADPAGGLVQVSGALTLMADADIVQGRSYARGALDGTDAIALQTGAMFAQNRSGDIMLGNAANQVSGVASLYAPGDILLVNAVSTTLGPTSNFSGGVLAGGKLTVVSAGDLTIASGSMLESDAVNTDLSPIDAITLVAGGNFINNAGADAVLATGTGASWKIYSAAPANDVFGGLDSRNTAVWNTTYANPATAAGNRYVFAFQPTLTLSASSISKVYGSDGTAALQQPVTVSGLQPGVANAYLGDDASIYSGTPVLTSAGAVVGAGVGSYAITADTTNFTNTAGYAVAVQAASTVTVTPATLLYVADAASRTYGAADPALTGAVTGFVNGDTLTSATSGGLAFGSSATSASGVGSYAITGSGLSASNYVFAQAAGNTTALTINPATLLYVADAASRTYGAADPALTGAITGFVNGDTLTSATSGSLAFGSSATAASGVGAYAVNGSGLSASNYVFQQAATNATALTINPATLLYVANAASRTYGAADPALTGAVTGFVNGDTLTSATSGALAFGSSATSASGVGSYAITGSGLLASPNYVLAQAAGNATALTINPATLLYVADAASKIYGGANPSLSGTVTGFVSGDTLTSATSGNLAFATGATSASGVGSYAITGSGLSASNYVFQQAASNAAALTINPATLLYVANAATRGAGAANPALSGRVSGFVNGDIQASATSGALVFTTTAGPTSAAGSYAVNGAGLSAVNYVFAQAASNATALTVTAPQDMPATPPAPILTAVTVALQTPQNLPPKSPPLAPPPPAPPLPPPPAPPLPPPPSPLADNDSQGQEPDPPTSSDQAASSVASSLDGGASAAGESSSTVVVPGMLVNTPRPPSGTLGDATVLSGFGNAALWQ